MNKIRSMKGITLISLVITIIILLILAGVSIALLNGENGLMNRAEEASEATKRESATEKVQLMLSEYMKEKYTGTKTLEEYLNEQKANGELDEVTNNGDGTITVEVEGYEITIKEDDLSIVSTEKAGRTRAIFEIKTTKTDGTALTGDETEKAITINITNIAEFGENYTIEIKDSSGSPLAKEINVISGITGQASYIINKSGTYIITVTATKDGITKTTIKTENITVTKAQIAETEVSSTLKTNGVIDIVWLDTENNVINEPITPANYLGGLTAIKYNETTKEEETVTAPTSDTSWYHYVAQTGTNDGKTSNWANARSSDSNAYFVWIPRYAYKITYFDTVEHANDYRANNDSKTGIIGYSNIEGMIAIKDGTEKLVTGSEPINVTGRVQTNQYAEYIPHPAFEFDGSKAGIWVGKFESSGSTSAVKIVANTNSLRNVKVGDIFTACQGVKNTYSLTSDSHMMKNSEWGAVAYLAESKYGRNGTKIARCDSDSYTTGQGNYVTYANQSTTGNIYGIYDMNGTSYEYVAGVLDSKLSNNNYYDFTKINSKYYNTYVSYKESKKIKGDGVYETSKDSNSSFANAWHQGASVFVGSDRPVFMRGR